MTRFVRLRAHWRRLAIVAAKTVLVGAGVTASSALAQERPTPPSPPEARPGFLGIEFLCKDCGATGERGEILWRFTESPLVLHVYEGSPAERAGLRPGDVMVRIDGVGLTTREGGRRLAQLREGEPVVLVIRRDDEEREVRIVPGRRPEHLHSASGTWRGEALSPRARAHLDSLFPRLRIHLDSLELALRATHGEAAEEAAGQRRWIRLFRDSIRPQLDSLALRILAAPRPRALERAVPAPTAYGFWLGDSAAVISGFNAVAGAQLTALSEELREYFPGAEAGILVLGVAARTPAADAGLRGGDVIVSAQGKTVAGVAELRRAFFESSGQPVQLDVVRKGKRIRVTIQSP